MSRSVFESMPATPEIELRVRRLEERLHSVEERLQRIEAGLRGSGPLPGVTDADPTNP
jgi:hypothetical protein